MWDETSLPAFARPCPNPIRDLTRTGAGTPTQIQRLYQPEDYRSGNEVNVSIAPVAGATAYQVWISAYENGRGARPVNARAVDGQVTEVQVCGLQPSIPLYFFVSYTDADGNSSKPSQAVRTVLVNEWPMQ